MKKTFIIVSLLLVLIACTKQPQTLDNPLTAELLVSEQLIIGISPDYPPFEDIDTEGNIIGFDVDLTTQVVNILNKAQGTNLTLVWQSMDFSTIVGALQAQQIDIGVSGITYDPDRDVYFSVPYISSQQVVVVNVDSSISTLSDLNGKKIGVQTRTTGESAAGEITGVKLVSLTDANQLFAQLKTSAIDAVIIDKAVGENYVKNNAAILLSEPLINEDMSIIIAKNKPHLQQALDAAITEFMKTDEYQKLLKKWDIAQ